MEEFDPGEDFVREFAEAEARASSSDVPRAVGARYVARRRMLVVALAGGAELHVPVASLEGLAEGSPDDLSVIEVTPAGTGLHFPRLDADIHVPSLVAGLTGSRRWMAAQPGGSAGSARPSREVQGPAAPPRRRVRAAKAGS